MTNSKIKIDLSQGLVEVEGSESFVKSIYEDFKEQIQFDHGKRSGKGTNKAKANKRKAEPSAAIKSRKRKPTSSMPTLVKDLSLIGGKDHKSLRDFYKQYEPANNMENNLIFVYYLQHEAHQSPITVDHIFTCYRHIPDLKVPKALQQSLVDTSNRKGWLDTSSLADIKTSVGGINYIEHDMKKASTE